MTSPNIKTTPLLMALLTLSSAHGEDLPAKKDYQKIPVPIIDNDSSLEKGIHHFQCIGTHNSYHIAPQKTEQALIKLRNPDDVKLLDYTHPPFTEQLDRGLRHFELDLYADPEGGRFAKPKSAMLAKLMQLDPPVAHDPAGKLLKPGHKIIHIPDIDYRSTALTLIDALTEINTWSKANPTHHPLMILLELKGKSEDWTEDNFQSLEKEILSTIPAEKIMTPDNLRGSSATLREAVLKNGWPKLKDTRGKIIFALDNGGAVRDRYLSQNPNLAQRLLFPSCPDANHPCSAFFKLNNPVASFDQIQKLVKLGYMVRTRCDSGTTEARKNETKRRDHALKSGAQWISTDFPWPRADLTPYHVSFPGGKTIRLRK